MIRFPLTQPLLQRRKSKSSQETTTIPVDDKAFFAYVAPIVRLPRSVGVLTYRIPDTIDHSTVKPGTWVRIPFRASIVDGIVLETTSSTEHEEKLRDILEVLDVPVLSKQQITVAQDFASLYAISLSHALYTFLPTRPKRLSKKKGLAFSKNETISEPLSLPRSVQEQMQNLASDVVNHETVFVPAGSLAERISFYFSFLSKSSGQTRIIVPTHALGQTIASHLHKRFGSRVILLDAAARRPVFWEQWQSAGTIQNAIVVTTKKGLLVSTHDLHTIILDTETDPSHKQNDQNPRFHARMVAILLQRACEAKLIALDTVPSLPFSMLQNAFLEPSLPTHQTMMVANLAHERAGKNFDPLSVANQEQVHATQLPVLLFLNRRGFARALHCRDCSWTLLCHTCGGTMTQHLSGSFLCHRCGSSATMPATCPQCHGSSFHSTGTGTEQLLQYCKKTFSEKSVTLVDSEHPVFDEKTDMVIATEQILQIPLLRLFGTVIAIQADQLFQYPDYKTKERALQILFRLTTLARYDATISLQTYEPDDTLFTAVKKGNYSGWYKEEFSLRKTLRLPPAIDVIKILGKSVDAQKVEHDAGQRILALKKDQAASLLSIEGPFFSSIVGGRFRQAMILVRILQGKNRLGTLQAVINALPDSWRIDPDPDHLLP